MMEDVKSVFIEKVDMLSKYSAEVVALMNESVCAENGVVTFRRAEATALFADEKSMSKTVVQARIVQMFNIVCGRAAVSEKHTFCQVDDGDRVVVVGKYGLALQKTRGEQARRPKDWHEFMYLYSQRDKVSASLRASSSPGVLALAGKFDLFCSILESTKFDKVPSMLFAEVPLVRKVMLPRKRLEDRSGEEVESLVVFKSWNEVTLGCREAGRVRDPRREFSEDGIKKIFGELQGAYVICAIDKEWDYYILKLKEQIAQRYGPAKSVLELLQEAFGSELMVASL